MKRLLPKACRFAFLATLVCALPNLSPRASSACPTSIVANGCYAFDWVGVETDLPGAQWDLSGVPQPWKSGDPCPNGCYDLRTGSSAASAYAGFQKCGNAVEA